MKWISVTALPEGQPVLQPSGRIVDLDVDVLDAELRRQMPAHCRCAVAFAGVVSARDERHPGFAGKVRLRWSRSA